MLRSFLLGMVLLFGLGAAPAFARQYCRDFTTCEQAMKSFKAGNTALDGDKDGIPCENLCGNR